MNVMFEDWGEFFLMVGSAAAVLIGLIFVVVTLMDDRPRATVLATVPPRISSFTTFALPSARMASGA